MRDDERTTNQGRGGNGGNAGMPGDGQGRVDETGHSGVHPASAGWPEEDMAMRREGEWGQGKRGLEGYDDSGESEILPLGLDEGEAGDITVTSEPGPSDAGTEPGFASGRSDSGSVAGRPGPADEVPR